MRFSDEINESSHVVHSISIGNDQQTGQYYEQMVGLILNNPNIRKITIHKADTLQRYRLMLVKNLSEEEAEKNAKQMSEAWEDENQETIKKLKNNKECEIITWDHYRNHENFKNILNKIEDLFKNNNDFEHDVKGIAKAFYKKYKLNHSAYNEYLAAFNILIKYVLEECTNLVLMSLDETKHYDYEIYFGDRNFAMKRAHKELVPNSRRMRFISIQSSKMLTQQVPSKPNYPGSFFNFRIAEECPESNQIVFALRIQKENKDTFACVRLKAYGHPRYMLLELMSLFGQSEGFSLDIQESLVQSTISFKIKLEQNTTTTLEQIMTLVDKYKVPNGKNTTNEIYEETRSPAPCRHSL